MSQHPSLEYINIFLKRSPSNADIFGEAMLEGEAWDKMWAPALDMVDRGGKRWRSLLFADVLASLCPASRGEVDGAFAPAYEQACSLAIHAIEYMHAGSLIIDDIEDASPLRRGKSASHMIFGLDIALNTGCFMYLYAIEVAAASARFAPELQATPTREAQGLGAHAAAPRTPQAAFAREPQEAACRALATRMLSKLHIGQGLDISWHRDEAALPTREDYALMASGKTGALVALSVGLAYELAGCEMSAELIEACQKIGVAFQIYDDLLNLIGGVPGKMRGDDLVEGKKSFPLICAREQGVHIAYSPSALRTASSKEVEQTIATVCRELEACGAFDQAIAIGESYAEEGFQSLKASIATASVQSAHIEQTASLAHESWWDNFLNWTILKERAHE